MSERRTEALRHDYLDRPLSHRFGPSRPTFAVAMCRHTHAIECGLSSYRDPSTGYTVLTAQYLADRGYCCNAGCRHCPYA